MDPEMWSKGPWSRIFAGWPDCNSWSSLSDPCRHSWPHWSPLAVSLVPMWISSREWKPEILGSSSATSWIWAPGKPWIDLDSKPRRQMGASVHHKWKPTTTVSCHCLLSIVCGLCMDSSDASSGATFCFSPATRSPNLFCNCPASGEGATFPVPEVRLGKSIVFNSVKIIS